MRGEGCGGKVMGDVLLPLPLIAAAFAANEVNDDVGGFFPPMLEIPLLEEVVDVLSVESLVAGIIPEQTSSLSSSST